jgi:hypothetical protein
MFSGNTELGIMEQAYVKLKSQSGQIPLLLREILAETKWVGYRS